MSGAFYFESMVSIRRIVVVMHVLRPDLPYLDVSSSPERLVECSVDSNKCSRVTIVV